MTDSTLQRLADAISPGSKLLRSWSLVGGISATMLAFEIEQQDGIRRKLISRQPGEWTLKRGADVAAIEFRLLQDLTKSGLPVPEPVYLDSESEFFPVQSLVIAYSEGAPEFAPKDLALYAQRSALQLSAIHKTEHSHLEGVPDAWKTITSRIHWHVEVPDHQQLDLEIRTMLKDILPSISQGPLVLLHGDFWPGNTLWQDGQLTCVIDWEEPRIGDALYDVSITRSELLFAFGEEAMDEFTEAYVALNKVDLSTLPFWDLCAALRPMDNFAEWAGAWPALGRDDITESTMRAAHLKFAKAAMDKL